MQWIKVPYKEREQAMEWAKAFVAEKALSDPEMGEMLTLMVYECNKLKYELNTQEKLVKDQGKEAHRNKEVGLRSERWMGAQDIAFIAFQCWVNKHSELFVKTDINTHRYVFWAACSLPKAKSVTRVLEYLHNRK